MLRWNRMDCRRFEEKLSDYFDNLLDAQDASLFWSHALQCRACRSLMDDVKTAIGVCKKHDEVEPSDVLEEVLAAIPDDHADLRCKGFEALITEFLDGYVPAPMYHRFEQHAEQCENCSNLLTGVVYAVAACHSVHTFEEVDVPERLLGRLAEMMPAWKQSVARRAANRVRSLAEQLIPRATQNARWTFATSALLALATFAFLLFGFSDDGTVAGVYRQAHVRASELYTQGADIYTQTDKLVARLERVGLGIGEFWDTLGGESRSDGKEKPERNSNKQVHSAEKN